MQSALVLSLKLSAAIMQPTGPNTTIVVQTDIARAAAIINELFEFISMLLLYVTERADK